MRELRMTLRESYLPQQEIHFEETDMYTIIGITGKTGGTAAKTLLAQGQKVRGIVRNGAKAAGAIGRKAHPSSSARSARASCRSCIPARATAATARGSN